MRIETPKIDTRSVDDLLRELVEQIPQNWPEWKPQATDSPDFGMALLRLAARMGEIIIHQLNRVPEKTFLTFLDFVGIDLLPPKSARVPLTFTLVDKAPADGFVPKGSKVGVAAASEIVFETEEELVVSRAALRQVHSLNVEQDRFTDLREIIGKVGSDAKLIFRDAQTDPTWPLIRHVLYLGHPTLFKLADEAGVPVQLTITLQGGNWGKLEWLYSGTEDWIPSHPTPMNDTTIPLNVSGILQREVKGYDKNGNEVRRSIHWIQAKMAEPLSAELPVIASITATVDVNKSGLAPDLARLNSLPIDLSKDFFPFGERPKLNDAFYIASDEVFSKPVLSISQVGDVYTITLEVRQSEYQGNKPDTSQPVMLAWEYWNGMTWNMIGQSSNNENSVSGKPEYISNFNDGTKAFTAFQANGSTQVTFNAPADWKPKEENGQKRYWMRIRIIGGGYGKEAGYRQITDQSLITQLEEKEPDPVKRQQILDLLTSKGLLNTAVYIPEEFRPPLLKSLTLTYKYHQTVTSGFSILTENNGVYGEFTDPPFQPFVRSEEKPTLYFGFESNPARPVVGTPITLFSQTVQPRYQPKGPNTEPSPVGSPPLVVWRYWDGSDWIRLPVEDETQNFTESGRVRFMGPATLKESILFGERLFWIKAVLEAGAFASPPQLQGIFLNTVWAEQGVTFMDQKLGSSNGEPAQSFSFSKPPVLQGEIIEIREPTFPTEAEIQKITAEEGPDGVRTLKDEAGVWVRWHPVTNFNLSGPSDRHYVVDRMKGHLLFGDGVRGRIPPPGIDNIRAVYYRSGGGKIGNQPAGTLTALKSTFPFVAAVVNHQPSSGGADPERIEEAMVRGPRQIKSRDRSVTAEDYEWLALQASGEVAKSRCLPLTRIGPDGLQPESAGWVTMIVVPQGEADQPVPTERLIKNVKEYLAERSLVTIKDRIEVIGPVYTPIGVTATVIPKRIGESKMVEKRVGENLKAFLHPLSGGPTGSGWEFGRDVYLSEIAAVVLGTEGVDQIQDLTLQVGGATGTNTINIPQDGLPSSGQHTVMAVWS